MAGLKIFAVRQGAFWQRFVPCEDGTTAIEYALIATLVSVAAIVGYTSLGSSLGNMFNTTGGLIAGVLN